MRQVINNVFINDVFGKISAEKEVNNLLDYELFDFFISGKNHEHWSEKLYEKIVYITTL